MCKKKIENRIVFPSILDREIENKENDRFGHIHFAEILYSLIKNNDAPFSIGLLGKWGVGKSSIKKLCRNEFLLKDKSKYKIIDFNAWRYESKDRTVIQILNTFLQGWWIAKQREQKCDECAKITNNSFCINNDNCLLIKNVITKRLDILAVISVAKILFPEFYQQLAIDSRLLKAMLIHQGICEK